MGTILFYLFYAIIWVLAWLPLGVLYIFSDLFYILVYHIVRYRRKMVRKNLTNAFPTYSKKEIKKIEKKFYLHFCDLFFETIYLMHISEKEMRKRLKFNNVELVKEWLKDGRSFIFMLGHYGNWEWITSIRLYVDDWSVLGGEVYKQLKNKHFNDFFLKLRSRFRTINIEMKQVYKAILECKEQGRYYALGFISDQSPSKRSIDLWKDFLNQDTAFIGGGERIAKKTKAGLVYFDMHKIKRGYYECDIVEMCKDASETADYEMTNLYADMLEKTILRDPAYWLWSHNRWKLKHKKD
ncbi:MAG: lysophospholipid acyltransferase family protein [Paludibacteraceae bacterium]|nr:lysophospholipid acyltransferase family protein [Paludibacteraceae bacterium]